jgi:hypothetical protein
VVVIAEEVGGGTWVAAGGRILQRRLHGSEPLLLNFGRTGAREAGKGGLREWWSSGTVRQSLVASDDGGRDESMSGAAKVSAQGRFSFPPLVC